MARFDLIERFLSSIVSPITNFLSDLWHHPADTVIHTGTSAVEFAQEHPYTCVAIIGVGAYAHHRGWIGCRNNRAWIDVEVDTPIGGGQIRSSLWCGSKKNR